MDKPIPEAVAWPFSILEAGNWREVYMGTKHMRLEVSYPYEAWERLMAALAAAQQQGQAVEFDGTDREVLREFIRICRERKPVGQWPGERVCAAIERAMANERPFRFIAEADRAPEREPSMKDTDRPLSGPRRNTAPPPSVPVVDEAMTRRIMADFHANDPGDVWPPDEQGRLRRQALQDAINKHLAAAPALAQQSAAVDEAMVERAWVAFCENNGSARQGIRAALTAALATKHQEPKKSKAKA